MDAQNIPRKDTLFDDSSDGVSGMFS